MKESTKQNVEQALSLFKQKLNYKEISNQMNRPESTIRRWLAPYNLFGDIKEALKGFGKKGNQRNYEICKEKRQASYDFAKERAKIDLKDQLLRDFINMYIGEGSKRDRNKIYIVNSDPKIILLSLVIMKKYFLKESKHISLGIRYYKENNNEKELLKYWQQLLNNDKSIIIRTYLQPTVKALGHNNSNKFGLVFAYINDTYAKQRLDAYMDYLKEEWTQEFENTFNIKIDRSITEVKAQIPEPSEVVKSDEDIQNSEIEYPYLKKLKKLVQEKGYVQVGKELGCSEVAVRKHILSRTKKIVAYPALPILKQMVAEKGYSEVARELGCSLETVRKHIFRSDSEHIPAEKKKVTYPDIPILISMLTEKSFVQVGKELGCSDNAIRKYLKKNRIDIKSINVDGKVKV